MKKYVILSANILGYELLRHSLMICKPDAVITLSDKSSIRMYDGVPLSDKVINGFTVEKGWQGICSRFNIPVFCVDGINDKYKLLDSLNPDYILVIGWREIICKRILDRFKNRIVGFHPTLLPFGRGNAPIINSILKGVKHSGVTLFFLNGDVDSGDIIGQECFNINDDDFASDVYIKIIECGKVLLDNYLVDILNGKASSYKQNNEGATYFEKPYSNQIFWGDSIDTFYRKIRAFNKPYLGAYVIRDNKKMIIWDAEVV